MKTIIKLINLFVMNTTVKNLCVTTVYKLLNYDYTIHKKVDVNT